MPNIVATVFTFFTDWYFDILTLGHPKLTSGISEGNDR